MFLQFFKKDNVEDFISKVGLRYEVIFFFESNLQKIYKDEGAGGENVRFNMLIIDMYVG